MHIAYSKLCLLMDENTRDILRNNYWFSADLMAVMLMHMSKRLVFLCCELNSFFLLIPHKKKCFCPPAWVPYHLVENQEFSFQIIASHSSCLRTDMISISSPAFLLETGFMSRFQIDQTESLKGFTLPYKKVN